MSQELPSRMLTQRLIILALSSWLCVACGGGGGGSDDPVSSTIPTTGPGPAIPDPNLDPNPEPDPVVIPSELAAAIAEAEARLDEKIEATQGAANYTVVLANDKGIFYSGSNNSHQDLPESTASSYYSAASSSKIISAAMIMRFVEQTSLSLDDNPQQYIPFWDNTGNRSQITLFDLLSMQSGLSQNEAKDPCLEVWVGMSLEDCVQAIHTAAADMGSPGTAVYYGGNPYQVAGYMLVKATKADLTYGADLAWHGLFEQFKADTGLLENAIYAHINFPFPKQIPNPSIGGGVLFRADEYALFLAGLANGNVVSTETFDFMRTDHTKGVPIEFLPGKRYGFRYGAGMFTLCDNPRGGIAPPETLAICDDPVLTKFASFGGYGSYPFIDVANDYAGVVAIEEEGVIDGGQGYAVSLEIIAEMEALAALHAQI